jgi:hypothetical protein
LIRLCLADAGLAAAVGLRAETGDDFVDDGARGVVARSVGRQDAVAVKIRLGENFYGVRRFLDRDGGLVFFAEIDEDLSGGGKDLFAFRRGVVDGGE